MAYPDALPPRFGLFSWNVAGSHTWGYWGDVAFGSKAALWNYWFTWIDDELP